MLNIHYFALLKQSDEAKPASLADEWSRRRSERIFLHEAAFTAPPDIVTACRVVSPTSSSTTPVKSHMAKDRFKFPPAASNIGGGSTLNLTRSDPDAFSTTAMATSKTAANAATTGMTLFQVKTASQVRSHDRRSSDSSDSSDDSDWSSDTDDAPLSTLVHRQPTPGESVAAANIKY